MKMMTFYDLMNNPPLIDVEIGCQQFRNSIQSVRKILNEISTAVEVYKNAFPQYIFEYNSVKETNYEEASRIWSHIDQECSIILTRIQNATELLNEAHYFLIEKRLAKWKCDQVLTGFGDLGAKSSNPYDQNPHFKNALDEIQTQMEDLFECVWITQYVLKVIRDCHGQAQCADTLEAVLAADITKIQEKLISSCLVVEEHPQVIHFDVK